MPTENQTIDSYISIQTKESQIKLQELRKAISEMVPNATESISYGIPTFKYFGNLVHFAAFKHHIGFYALPSAHESFSEELAKYKQGKGSVQFPLGEPLPLNLIKRMVKFRVKENEAKNKKK